MALQITKQPIPSKSQYVFRVNGGKHFLVFKRDTY